MTYAQLITQTQTALGRSDSATQAQITSALELCHQDEIQQWPDHDWQCQEKRSAHGALPYTSSEAADGKTLPTDFLKARDLWVEATDDSDLLKPLEFIDADALREKERLIAIGEENRPTASTWWTIRNGKIVLWPAFSATAETIQLRLDYYAKLPFYIGAVTTDWFSQNAGMALVYYAAYWVCQNVWDDDRAGKFFQLYNGKVVEAIQKDKRLSGSPRRAWTPPREYYAKR